MQMLPKSSKNNCFPGFTLSHLPATRSFNQLCWNWPWTENIYLEKSSRGLQENICKLYKLLPPPYAPIFDMHKLMETFQLTENLLLFEYSKLCMMYLNLIYLKDMTNFEQPNLETGQHLCCSWGIPLSRPSLVEKKNDEVFFRQLYLPSTIFCSCPPSLFFQLYFFYLFLFHFHQSVLNTS